MLGLEVNKEDEMTNWRFPKFKIALSIFLGCALLLLFTHHAPTSWWWLVGMIVLLISGIAMILAAHHENEDRLKANRLKSAENRPVIEVWFDHDEGRWQARCPDQPEYLGTGETMSLAIHTLVNYLIPCGLPPYSLGYKIREIPKPPEGDLP